MMGLLADGALCLVGLAVYDITSACGVSPARLDLAVSRRRVESGREVKERDLLAVLDRVCAWYVHPVKCLQRSVVGTWLLRVHGCPAELVIGYRFRPIEGHAWIQVSNTIVNDLPTYARHFHIVYRSVLT